MKRVKENNADEYDNGRRILHDSNFSSEVSGLLLDTATSFKYLESEQKHRYSILNVFHAKKETFIARVKCSDFQQSLVLKFYNMPYLNEKYEKDILDYLKEKNCENILYYLDYGSNELGFFFVFPFIEEVDPPSDFPEVWNFLREVAIAIAGCHENEVLHCDIKPSNVIVSLSGKVLLIDFEASQIGIEHEDPWVMGTYAYWSPEVCDRLDSAHDFPRDVWAFGALILDIVYGVRFLTKSSSDPDTATRQVNKAIKRFLSTTKKEDIPWPNLIPKNCTEDDIKYHSDLQKLLLQLLERDPHKRITMKKALEYLNKSMPSPYHDKEK